MSRGKVKPIDVGQFVTLQTSDYAEQYGLKKKDVLYVAGDGITAVSEEDPYQLRRILLCARVDKDGHVLAQEGALTVDGLKLKAVTKPRQDKLEAIFVEDFGGDDEEEADQPV